MDKGFTDIIQLMAREQGKEVLLNGKAKLFLSDYRRGQFPNEADIFLRILNANCGELINNADNVLKRKRKLMVRLEDENGLSPKKTAEYLDLLGLILKGDTSKAETSTEAKAAAEAKAAKAKAAAEAKTAADAKAATNAKAAALRPVKGKITFEDSSVYEGDLVNDIPHGKGKYTWPSGNVYEGDWVNGYRTGKGKFTWPNGAVYEGDWVNDVKTGKGKYTWANGLVQEGNFKDGKFVDVEQERIEQQRIAEEKAREEQHRLEEQKRVKQMDIEQRKEWLSQGLCVFCGGKLSLITKVCKSCGRVNKWNVKTRNASLYNPFIYDEEIVHLLKLR